MSWRRFLRRGWWSGERARELASYLEIEIAENIARGMTARDAESAARRKLGNRTLIQEEIYRMNTLHWFDDAWQDLRYAARLLCLSPRIPRFSNSSTRCVSAACRFTIRNR